MEEIDLTTISFQAYCAHGVAVVTPPQRSSIQNDKQWHKDLREVFQHQPQAILIDGSQIEHANSYVLSSLLWTRKNCDRFAIVFLVFAPHPSLQQIMQITEVDRLIPLCDDEDSARCLLRERYGLHIG